MSPAQIKYSTDEAESVAKFRAYRALGGNSILAKSLTCVENVELQQTSDSIVKIWAKFDKVSGVPRKSKRPIAVSAPLRGDDVEGDIKNILVCE